MQWPPPIRYQKQIRWALRIRRWHIWAGVITSLPAFLILGTGLLLLLRRELPSIHPPTLEGSRVGITLSLAEVIEQMAMQGNTLNMQDVSKAEALPSKGIWKVRNRSGWEVQVDGYTGEILNSQRRSTGFLIALHEGSYFSLPVMYLVFLPSTVLMIWLWASGLYLFFRSRRE